jgi:uncharacterized protein YbjT (DUF2867 family)
MAKLLLAGATGLVGGHALALALADDRVRQVVAPTRRPLAAHRKLRNPIVDAGALPGDADWWAVDGVACALGTTRAAAGSAAAFRAIDYEYALAFARHARSAGATRFALTSAMGADARSRLLYPRTKGELEEAVRRLDFAALAILRPGFLGGARGEHRPVERLIGALLRVAAPVLPAQARISPAATVAALLVEAAIAGDPGTHVISAADIATAAERASGGRVS